MTGSGDANDGDNDGNGNPVKRAADMLLLGGATLVREPCPYCGGVRVIRDGDALCAGCGRSAEKRDVAGAGTGAGGTGDGAGRTPAVLALEKRMDALAVELESERDGQRQQEIIRTMEALAGAMARIGGAAKRSSSQDPDKVFK